MKLTAEHQQMMTANAGLIGAALRRNFGIRANDTRYEDLYQEGFIALARAAFLYRTDGGAKFSTYAMWSIRRHIREALTKMNRRGFTRVGDVAKVAGTVSLDASERTELIAVPYRSESELRNAREYSHHEIDTSLASPQQRQVLDLYLQGLKVKEIAARLGLTPALVRSVRGNAVVSLRRKMGVARGEV